MVQNSPRTAPPVVTHPSEWEVMAVPRNDAMDTELLKRRFIDSRLSKESPPHPGEATIFKGQVALRQFIWPSSFLKRFNHAPFDHPNISEAERLLQCWPEISEQCGALLNAFNPCLIVGVENELDYNGSNSHQPDNTIGAIWATVHNPVLLAQALVHELAHNKLFALGLHFENAYPFFRNKPSELYDSPIRLDIPRPISAVFHGIYAFTHVLALDLKLYNKGPVVYKDRVLPLVHHNMMRMVKGTTLIRKCAQLTREGELFVNSFLRWSDQLIREATRISNTLGIKKTGPTVLIGPAGGGKTTLANRWSQKTGEPHIILEKICWDVWWQTPLIQEKLMSMLGSEKMVKAFGESKKYSKKTLLWNWMKQGIISHYEIDQLKLILSQFALSNFKNGILEYSSGLCQIQNSRLAAALEGMLGQASARVVLVRPVCDLDRTVDILVDRTKNRNHPNAKMSIRTSLEHPAFRRLADEVIDTE